MKAFQHLDDNTLAFESAHKFNTSSTEYKAGEKLEELGACNNCHFYGTTFPKQGAQTWAPNLAMTKDRLRPDWVVEWLRNPQSIMPGTQMPAPYLPTEDLLNADDAIATWGKPLVDLKGDHDAMLEGLREIESSILKGSQILVEKSKRILKKMDMISEVMKKMKKMKTGKI